MHPRIGIELAMSVLRSLPIRVRILDRTVGMKSSATVKGLACYRRHVHHRPVCDRRLFVLLPIGRRR
jgi:hypothetical protein